MACPAFKYAFMCSALLFLLMLGTKISVAYATQAGSLKESVNSALVYSPALKSVQESYQMSQHALARAKGGRLPSAYLSAGGGTTQRSNTLTKAFDEEDDWNLTGDYSLKLVQPLWHGGSIINDIKLREFLFNSADYTLESEGVNLAYSAVAAHVEVVKRHRLLELAEINVTEHEKILRIMRQRYDSNVATTGELSQVQNRQARAIATKHAYQTSYDNARSNYLRITGKHAGSLMPVALPGKLHPSLQFARGACLKGNLRLKAAMENLFATEKEKALAQSNFWPKLDFEVGHNWSDRAGDANESVHGMGAMLRLNWEFFSGGRDKANVAMSSARIRQSKQALYALMDSLNEDVESTYHMYESALLQESEYTQARKASLRTKEDYNRQFISAKRSIVDVLDAENDLFYAASQELLSHYDKVLASYRILALSSEILAELDINPAALRTLSPTTSDSTRNILTDAPSHLNTLRTPQ